MSRSNPTANGAPNPSTRWFEWNGEAGLVRYYDKAAQQTVEVGADFTFILLDQLGTVRGWDDANQCGIYSNEVRDTRQEPLIVKSFKGGILAEGIYQNIKDRVNRLGGSFVANCYLAYKSNGHLAIGAIGFKGAALGVWMEFTKAHRAELFTKAIRIHGYTEGKKGKVVYRTPKLSLNRLEPATDEEAIKLDKTLQAYLDGYFARTKREQVNEAPREAEHEAPEPDDEDVSRFQELTDDDIPF